MNAYDKAPKGRTFEHALIRIETNRGVEGRVFGPSDKLRPVLDAYAHLGVRCSI